MTKGEVTAFFTTLKFLHVQFLYVKFSLVKFPCLKFPIIKLIKQVCVQVKVINLPTKWKHRQLEDRKTRGISR